MSLEGKKAPAISLPDQDGNNRTLKEFQGQKVLLYFYPKDDTPGCTKEACNFRDSLNDLKEFGVQVIGVSKDGVESHKKFVDKFKLNFPLLADEEKKTIENYGVWVEKSLYGKKYMGISRDSFLIDEKGMVVKHYHKVQPAKHVGEVLKDLKKK